MRSIDQSSARIASSGSEGLVISASRRTDLPGFHPDETAARLRRLRRPVHSVFFWTKHPGAFAVHRALADCVARTVENPFLLFTVTGLGGGPLEPRVPPWREALRALPGVIARFGGEPRRLRWRFDPLIPGVGAAALFGTVAPAMAGLGIEECIVSLPARASLKGSLAAQYARHGIAPWGDEELARTFGAIVETARGRGIALSSCATPLLVRRFAGAVRPAACVGAALAARLHPRALPLEDRRDPSQRRACGCTVSRDIGSYDRDRCLSGCAYCYSRAGGPGVE